MDMQQKPPGYYLNTFKRRKAQFIIPLSIVLVLTLLLVVLIPPTYRSSAIILIEHQDIPEDLVQSTITSYADERIQVISQRVLTNANLSKIIDKYDLYERERETETREEVFDSMREDDIGIKMISADVIDPRSGRPTQATIAFELKYENRSPLLAQQVANELVSLYLSENLKSRTKKAAEAVGFLTDEAGKLNAHIHKLEEKLAIFKEKNSGRLPELRDLNLQLLERTDRGLLDVDQKMRSLEESKIYLESELAKLSPSATLYSNTGERILTPYGRLKALETEYLSAQAIYTEDHPDIVKMKRELKALRAEVGSSAQSKEEIAKQLEGLQGELAVLHEKYGSNHPDIKKIENKIAGLEEGFKTATKSSEQTELVTADNPAYVELKARLDTVNADTSSLLVTRQQIHKKIKKYENYLIKTPQVEREYISLTREHEYAIAKYKDIIVKQASAKLAEELEKDSKGERFVLIEPPLQPEKPFKPNRLAIIMLGLILSIGSGIGTVLVFDSMDKTIRDTSVVSFITGFAPLSSIPYIVTDLEVAGRKKIMKYSLFGFAAALVASIVSINYLYKPLDVIWFIALRKLGL